MFRAALTLDTYVTEAVQARLANLTVKPPTADPVAAAEAEQIRARLAEVADSWAAMALTTEQVARINRQLRAKLADAERRANPPRAARVLHGLPPWDDLPLDRQRAVVSELLQVVVHPAGAGRRVFNPDLIELRWR